MKTFSVHCGTFDYDLLFCLTPDPKQAIKFIKSKMNWALKEKDFDCLGKFFWKENYCPVVWLPGVPRTPRQKGTAAHEIFHAVCAIMCWAGVTLGEDSEEAFAHMTGYLTTKFYENINK